MTEPLYLDNTIMSTFDRCKRLFYWRHIRHLVPAGCTGAPLILGKAFHNGLEYLYLGYTLQESVDHLHATYLPKSAVDDKGRTPENAERILRAYHKKYFPETFKVVATEAPILVELSCDVVFVGLSDLIVKDKGSLYTYEHKTTANAYYLCERPNHQISGYIYGLRLLGYDVKGGVLNIAKILKPTTRVKQSDWFIRQQTTRTDEDMRDWYLWVMSTKEAIDQCLDRKFFPQNTGECYRCNYRDLCTSGEETVEMLIKHQYRTEAWEPWKDSDKEPIKVKGA